MIIDIFYRFYIMFLYKDSTYCIFLIVIVLMIRQYEKTPIGTAFKTQPSVDRRFRLVSRGFYHSNQWEPPETGRNRRLTTGWILKSFLNHVNWQTENSWWYDGSWEVPIWVFHVVTYRLYKCMAKNQDPSLCKNSYCHLAWFLSWRQNLKVLL